ncbi:type II toxin-antitoxin system VapC family toxin [Natronolimnobius sp. AArcel1]|uniref:PIN domain-containing protein n=1 Tax=Natronolimnobius sp. AArcel1 TaxID=1679093 RepID=UPI0013ED833C|nr:PIN domain-containing protein [Natronolimnobius sp. AArcel1]NGM68791.1 type II toxin-antitoxin system VapC family toxin [Natronolimnobius sp. AArcel1]
MQYLDSWVWIEYVLGGAVDDAAKTVLEAAHDDGGVTSTIALTEIDYIIRRELDQETADFVTSSIEDSAAIRVIPVSSDIALQASNIRSKYYSRRERELSYADAIHIATALQKDCSTIQTGDADFDGLDEIDAVVHQK